MKPSDAAVSEVIGFVLIFAIVMAGIGMVTMYGYPVLMQAKANADSKNMEQTLIVLQNEIKSLAYKSVPYREMGIQVAGGSLSLNAPEGSRYFEFIPVPPLPDTPPLVTRFYPGELHYQSEKGVHTVIQNGAVIDAFDGANGSVMVSEPRWYIDTPSQTLVINLIQLAPEGGSLSQTSLGTVKMHMDPPETTTYSWPGDVGIGNGVRIQYHEDIDLPIKYKDAWTSFIRSTLPVVLESGGSDPTVWFDIQTNPRIENVIIKTYTIKFSSL
jgi:hypothetical protein